VNQAKIDIRALQVVYIVVEYKFICFLTCDLLVNYFSFSDHVLNL